MPDTIPNVIKLKMPATPPLGRNAEADDLTWVWDSQLAKLRRCKISELPFGTGGGGGGTGTLLGSPFKMRRGNAGVTIVTVSPGVFNTEISDLRLIGKTDYPVNSTQLNNAAFRDDELIYNAVIGKVTIKNFNLLAGEVVILYPDGMAGSSSGNTGGSFDELQTQIDSIKQMLAPFTPDLNGKTFGRVWWTGPVESIPAGWAIDTSQAGYFPMPMSQSDDDFKTVGNTGGAKTHTNTEEEMFPHSHAGAGNPGIGDNYKQGGSGRPLDNESGNKKNNWTESRGGYLPDGANQKVAKPYSIMNPYKVGNWIKYVGG